MTHLPRSSRAILWLASPRFFHRRKERGHEQRPRHGRNAGLWSNPAGEERARVPRALGRTHHSNLFRAWSVGQVGHRFSPPDEGVVSSSGVPGPQLLSTTLRLGGGIASHHRYGHARRDRSWKTGEGCPERNPTADRQQG